MQSEDKTREDRLLDALREVLPALVAAVGLLERGGKKAAPSNAMFEQMLRDYKAAAERGRAIWLEIEK